MGFRNSSQNWKAVKIERDSRSNTKFNIKSPPTLFKKKRNKIGKSRKKLKNVFPNSSQSLKAAQSERHRRSHTKSMITLFHTNFKFFCWQSRKNVGKMSKKWFSETRLRLEKLWDSLCHTQWNSNVYPHYFQEYFAGKKSGRSRDTLLFIQVTVFIRYSKICCACGCLCLIK